MLYGSVYDAAHHRGADTPNAARIEGIQLPSGVALPPAGALDVAVLAQEPCIFFFMCSSLSARAVAAAIARADGVDACEGTRPAAATLPSCGSGRVLARAGKALDARRLSGSAAQGARGCTSASGSCGDASAFAHFFIAAGAVSMGLAVLFGSETCAVPHLRRMRRQRSGGGCPGRPASGKDRATRLQSRVFRSHAARATSGPAHAPPMHRCVDRPLPLSVRRRLPRAPHRGSSRAAGHRPIHPGAPQPAGHPGGRPP